FKVAGRQTPAIAPGKSATLKVTVTTGRSYPYYSAAKGRAGRLAGALVVVPPPCTNPQKTTVTVQMTEAPMKVSQTTIPCGTVTLVVTNVGTIVHTFTVLVPEGQTAAPGGLGPPLS